MFELRWIWHDFKEGPPPTGSICVVDCAYIKLQYRSKVEVQDNAISGMYPNKSLHWSEWKDVKGP